MKPNNSFDAYQDAAMQFAVCPDLGVGVYPALGLAGESGELCEKVKKVHRDENGVLTVEKRADIRKEAGDVLWYLARLCHECGLTLSEVAAANLEKLADRARRDQLKGSGDDR